MRKTFIWGTAAALLTLPLAATSLALTPPPVSTQTTDVVTDSFTATATLPQLDTTQLESRAADFLAPQQSNLTTLPGGMTVENRAVASLDLSRGAKMIATVDIHSDVALVAAKWPAEGTQPVLALGRYLRGKAWSDWETIGDEFETSKDAKTNATSSWVVTNASRAQIALVSASPGKSITAKLEVIDPGRRVADQKYALTEDGQTQAGPAPATATGPDGGNGKPDADENTKPAQARPEWTNVAPTGKAVPIYSRADWGADESWMGWTIKAGAIQSAVVHHTVSGNNYSADQVPAILRSIYRYHAISLGWGDIGYNVLVDNFGRAWQGRAGDLWSYNTVAGHVAGFNAYTFGISVLGDYREFRPSDAAIDTVARVIAFKLKPTGLNPLELNTAIGSDWGVRYGPVVAGHRDLGPTSCPGQAFYDYLPTLRQIVASYMAQPASPVVMHGAAGLEQQQVASGVPLSLAGDTRVLTSLAIARHAFPRGAETVYLARADNPADALAGGSLTDGPIVLGFDTQYSAQIIAQYLQEAGAKQLVVLGGGGAISQATAQTAASGRPVTRLYGPTRVETAAVVALRAKQLNPGMTKVYLAESLAGIDALSAGMIKDGPVLLVPTHGTLPAAAAQTINQLNPQQVVALGGTNAVSQYILNQAAFGRSQARISGPTRYETAVAISQQVFPNGANHAYLANGVMPIDAVAGGILNDGPILPVPGATGSTLDGRIQSELQRLGVGSVTALGGAAVVSSGLLRSALVSLTPRAAS